MKKIFALFALTMASATAEQYYQTQQVNQTYSPNASTSQNDMKKKTVSDEEISKKVRDVLMAVLKDNLRSVTFEVENGKVTVHGTVDSAESKSQIDENVKRIDGVKQLDSKITVNNESADAYSTQQPQNMEMKSSQDFGSNSMDQQINSKIRDKLMSWKNNKTIVIKTTGGFVVISGTVDKPEDVQMIKDLIKNVEGVKNVDYQLKAKK